METKKKIKRKHFHFYFKVVEFELGLGYPYIIITTFFLLLSAYMPEWHGNRPGVTKGYFNSQVRVCFQKKVALEERIKDRGVMWRS